MRNIMTKLKSVVIFGLMFAVTNCDTGRIPSKTRLEENCHIKLPLDFKVRKDEYQDMLQDYCILYDIELNVNSSKVLTSNIRASKFYNPNVRHQGVWLDNSYVQVDSTKAVWCKSRRGYDFRCEKGYTSYFVTFDTVTRILNYVECAD